MAKLRTVKRSTPEGVPVELMDVDDPAWSSVDHTLQWCVAHGLIVDDARLSDGPRSRHKAATGAWAVAEGYVTEYGRPRWVDVWELGVPRHGGDVMRERLGTIGWTAH